jgi:histidine kinase/DNA gyrase B/HSP90-like ATPase
MISTSPTANGFSVTGRCVENALNFSPPDRHVEVRGRRLHQSGYELAIMDAGLGMSPDELAQANRRLTGAESFTVAPSKYLGHYVAGNLAARHGIALRLDPAPGQGTIACIELPPNLLTTGEPLGETAPAPHDWPPSTTGGPWADPGGHPAIPAASLPAGVPRKPNSAPAMPATSDPTTAAGDQRTINGVVRRSPLTSDPDCRTAPTVPSDELLAALRGHATRLKTQRPDRRPQHSLGRAPDASPGRPPAAPVTPPERTEHTRSASRAALLSVSRADSSDAGTTASGLTRRTPGAHLPTTEPLLIRRDDRAGLATHGPDQDTRQHMGAGDPPGCITPDNPVGDHSSAQDVYGFLTNFTAGVQRGLDEARESDP